MNGTVRALLGAAAGAILTLLAHPASRPFLASTFWHPAAIDSTEQLEGTIPDGTLLGRPKSLIDASIWMQAAAERMLLNRPLTPAELASAVVVAQSASKIDPSNAYWRQMLAVFRADQKRPKEAEDLWERAAVCTSWNDFQTKRLELMKADLAARYGASQSWQYARVYKMRSLAPVEAIETFARRTVEAANPATVQGQILRFYVIKNGDLVRNGAQSLSAGRIGANIVEGACHPSGLEYGVNIHRLLYVRGVYLNALKQASPEFCRQATQIYHENDSWKEFLDEKDASGNLDRLGLISVFVATLPSAFLALALVGTAIWGLGVLVQESRAAQEAFRYPAVFFVGFVMALASVSLTHLPLNGLAIGLCTCFLAFTPKNERSRHPESLGPFFKFATGFLALAFLCLLSLYFIVKTPPSLMVFESMDYGNEIALLTPVLLGLALIVFGLLVLIAPFWAFAQRIRTTLVLSRGMRTFGAFIASAGFTGSILLCLAAIYADRVLSNTMSQLVTNEPLHYSIEK